MPWYQLPHADMVMWFDQEMDLEPADAPFATGGMVKGSPDGYPLVITDDVVIPNAPEPEEETAPFATGGVFKRLMHKIGHPEGVIDEVVTPNVPEPDEEAEAT